MVKGAFTLSAIFCLLQSPCSIPALAENPLIRMKNAAMSKVSASSQSKKPAAALEIRDKWGVFIGVGRYQDPTITPLPFAYKNTTALTEIFKNVGVGRFAPDHVVAIANAAASKDAIENILTDDWLCKKALPEDLVVIYICTRFVRGDAGRGVMLLANDSKLENAGVEGIPLSSLLANVKRRLQSRRVVAFLDLSPAVPPAPGANTAEGGLNIERIAANSGVTVLSATKGMQQSQQSASAPVSSFTQYLVEGMSADAGTQPLATVAAYVSESVTRDAGQVQGKDQTPLFLAAADSPDIVDVPLGVRLKSSIPPKSVHIGHSLDQLAMQRPDIKYGAPGRMTRSKTLIAANLPNADLTTAPGATATDARPVGAPKTTPAAKTTPAKVAPVSAPAKPAAKEASDDDDENDDTPPQNVDMGPYMKEMKQLIQSKWSPPKGMNEKHVVSVFTIKRNGTIIDPTITESSGDQAIDDSALAALKAASPLPKLPAGSPHYIQIRYKFDWKVKPSSGSGN
ncbi:MAG: hypothetical protein DKT66_17630 [Candidatus Melainabacteria bacterium]|nr:MAG: hypothetical protein DKT66_17630 [Candidatus Melainabacteria bacterium]